MPRLKKNTPIPIADVRRHLLSVIGKSNKEICTSVHNMNTSHLGYGHVSVYIVFDGKITNISYYVGLLLNIQYRTRQVTDFVKVKGGEDMGKWVTRMLQKKLYDGMFLKEELTHRWV